MTSIVDLLKYKNLFGGKGSPNATQLVAANGTPQSAVTGTGTTTTFPMGTIAIPAGTLSGLNGVIEATISIAANNTNANVKTVKATLNTQDLGIALQMAGQAAGEFTVRIQAKNATNAQQVRNTTTPSAAPTQTTVDMTQAQNITILGTLTNAGDALNITNTVLRASNV